MAVASLGLVLASLTVLSGCPSQRGAPPNIILVTVESLRADRLAGPPPARDPLATVRSLAGEGGVHEVLASSSQTLPSLASLMTGRSPAETGVLEEGLDRLGATPPTLPALLQQGGYRTSAFPTLDTLGLASGLSRGFATYAFPPGSVVGQASPAETNSGDWLPGGGRRQGKNAVADALQWIQRHRSERLFVWIHLAEALSPYASDQDLARAYGDNQYDAALAYEDRCIKTLIDGLGEIGLADRTTVIVAGDHGESLGDNGESLHGLNLYPSALATAVAVIPPRGRKAPEILAGPGEGKRASLQSLFGAILAIARVQAPGAEASSGAALLPVDASRPLLAVTLDPRSAFGWNGRLGLCDESWCWVGPEDEEMFALRSPAREIENRIAEEGARARAMREKALMGAGPIAKRLRGRKVIPPPAERQRLLALLRAAASPAPAAGGAGGAGSSLDEAWKIDPGNFEVAVWLARIGGQGAADRNRALLAAVADGGANMPEALLTKAKILEVTPGAGSAFDAYKEACAISGDGCTVDLAMRSAAMGQIETAATLLAPVAERASDADLWRVLGELYLGVENTYKAGQALAKAAALDPDDVDIMIRQGDSLAVQRDFKGAYAQYKQVDTKVSGLPIIELKLGALARQQGDRAAAVEHFKRALGGDQNSPSGALALGKLLADQGMSQEAIPLLMDAASRMPSSAEPLFLAAQVHASEGNLDEAEKTLRAALDREPANGPCLYALARLLAYRGKREEAGRTLERLALVATPEVAVAALRDDIFAGDSAGGPLIKGLQALYQRVSAAAAAAQGQGGGAASGGAPAAPPGGAVPSGAPATRNSSSVPGGAGRAP